MIIRILILTIEDKDMGRKCSEEQAARRCEKERQRNAAIVNVDISNPNFWIIVSGDSNYDPNIKAMKYSKFQYHRPVCAVTGHPDPLAVKTVKDGKFRHDKLLAKKNALAKILEEKAEVPAQYDEAQPEVLVAPSYPSADYYIQLAEYIVQSKKQAEEFKSYITNSLQKIENNFQELNNSAVQLSNLDEEAFSLITQAQENTKIAQATTIGLYGWFDNLVVDGSEQNHQEFNDKVDLFDYIYQQATNAIAIAKQKIAVLLATNVILNSQPLNVHEQGAVLDNIDFNDQILDLDVASMPAFGFLSDNNDLGITAEQDVDFSPTRTGFLDGLGFFPNSPLCPDFLASSFSNEDGQENSQENPGSFWNLSPRN